MSGVKSNNSIALRMERLLASRPEDWMSIPYLAMMFGCAESTIKQAMAQMRQKGVVFERDKVYRIRRDEATKP